MWLFVLTVLSCICFGFLLDVSSVNAEVIDEDLVKRINATVNVLADNNHKFLILVQKDRSDINSLIQRLNKTEDKMEKLVINEESLNQKIQALQTLTSEQQRELNKAKSMSKEMTRNYNDLLFKVNREVDFLKKQNHDLERKRNTTEEKMAKLISEKETSSYNIETLQNITSQQQHELNKAKSESKRSRLSVRSSLTLLDNALQDLTNSTGVGFRNLNGNVLNENKLLRDEMRKFEKKNKQRINKKLGNIESAMALSIEQSSLINSLITSKLQKMTDEVMESTEKVTNLELTTDELLTIINNLTLMSSKMEKNFKDVEELKADEAVVDSFMKIVMSNNTLIASKLQRITGDIMETTRTRTRVTKLESSTNELLPSLTVMSSKIDKNFKDLQELKSDAELSCRLEKFTCTKQFQCINVSRKCDGFADCSDRTDEEGCAIPITISINPKNQTKMIGSNVYFRCNISLEGTPLEWNRQGKIDIQPKSTVKRGRLTIPDLDSKDAGIYICSGTYNNRTYTEFARLIVRQPLKVQPSIIVEPSFQTVNEFETAQFRCITTGRPAPIVEWRRGTGTMNPSAVISGGVLRIPAAIRSDEAQYFCKASNVAGTTEVRTILYVKSNPRPPTDITVIVRQVAIIATIGSTEQLICYIDDNSVRPTLIWSRNGGLPSGSAQDNGVLTLNNIQPSFAGSYVCTAITPNGDRETGTTSLTVRPEIESTLPTATVTPDRTTIPQETNGTIRCSVTGTPQPKITWSKSRGELTARHQVFRETLIITNAQTEDRGVYICRAENTAGLGQGWAIVEVKRRTKPKLDIYPAISQTIKTGESALFQCRVMGGDPLPNVTWSRAKAEPILSTIDAMENGVIMFKEVTGEEAGGYICTATNEMGSVTATATLIIQGPPRIVISPSKKVCAVIGQRVSLKCTGEGDPIPTVQWKYERAPDRGDVPTPVEGALSQGSATLTLNAVSRSDSGNYYCTANNVAGSVTETVQLEVQESGQPPRETGVTIRGPGQRTVREGETVTIECDTTGIRNAVVRWRKRDGLMPPNHSVRGGTLTIPNFRSVYSGEYICSASSPVKNYETSVFIIITVPPTITLSQREARPYLGQLMELRCQASGNPPPSITWEKENGVLPLDHTVNNGVLQIFNVRQEDSGRYICQAASQAGVDREYVTLTVQGRNTGTGTGTGPIRIDTKTVNIGERVEMECVATGTPIPTVTWSRIGEALPETSTVNDVVLVIPNIRIEDAGTYVCTAHNLRGTIQLRVNLFVKDPTEDTTECHSGWIKSDDYGACYFFSNKTMSWNDAQEQCRKQNGSLADILSENEAVWLAESIRNHDGTEFWIGGKRYDDVYQWVTFDGKTKDMNYTRWALGEPNGVGSYCVEIDKRFQYKWKDSACVWSQHFICKLYLT